MKKNSRLSASLHALVHLAQVPDQPMTSEHMASWLRTNPVVVRRMVAGLREAGILNATRGHGGGWTLGRPAAEITLADVAVALGESFLPFNTEPESPGCMVERAVNLSLDEFRIEAERLLMKRLGSVTLADIAAQCGRGVAAYKENTHAI